MTSAEDRDGSSERADLRALSVLVSEVRGQVATGDRDGLERSAVTAMRIGYGGRSAYGRQVIADPDAASLLAALDELYDRAYPLPASRPPPAGRRDLTEARTPAWMEYVADLLSAPWPSERRSAALAAVMTGPCALVPGRDPNLTELADEVIAAPRSGLRTRLLRLLACPVNGYVNRAQHAQLLGELHAEGALEPGVIEAAFAGDKYLGYAVFGLRPARGEAHPAQVSPACAAWIRDQLDEITWRLTAAADPCAWAETPRVPAPRGPRFVLRGLDLSAGRLKPAAEPRPGSGFPADLIEFLCGAELSETGLAELNAAISERDEGERREAFRHRYRAGDAEALLTALGLDAAAAPMLRLLWALDLRIASAEGHPVACDLARIHAVVQAAGPDAARLLLRFCDGISPATELVAAAMSWNRDAVLKRFRNNALLGIAAYGLLPFEPGETASARYLALLESAKKGAKLGPNRRHSHAAAVEVAMGHLAQVAGYPDADRLEWDIEARIIAAGPGELRAGDYDIAIAFDGAEPTITVHRQGKALKSVPAPLRKEPAYTQAREYQERLRDQARRMRSGLIERLVATGGQVAPGELDRLLSLPAGAAMLPALIWRDERGGTGLLDPAPAGPALAGPALAGPALAGPALVGLDETRVPVSGPVTAAHPWHLYQDGTLGSWQAEIIRRRIRQPVKQAFRELYLLTPAEAASGRYSRRFDGHVVEGKIAGQLLSGRGWSTFGNYDDNQAERAIGEVTAGATCNLHGGHFGGGPVTIGGISFKIGGVAADLALVPPLAFSEAMRDLDLVVSVAGTAAREAAPWDGGLSGPATQSRAELLSALITELGLEHVSVSGHFAEITGSRARYRVHLGSGSIHIEPGGYLCIVPAAFGQQAHPRLFLPFADQDMITSVILSKILLLAEDEKITDRSILAQLP